MSDWLKNIIDKVKSLNSSVEKYKQETVIQSLPTYTYVNRAKLLIEQNQYDEALQILLKALELPQKDALVYKYLGTVYERLGDFEKSVENYQMSADLNPQDRNIWQRLGFSLISVGKYENAVKSFDNANKIQPNNSDTYTGWGMALMKQKQYAQAHDKFIEAVKYNKNNFSAVFLCSIMEIKLEMYDKAEMKLTFLANVCPNANNTYEFARLKYLKKDYESAIHYAQKSLDFNSKMLPSYILLGQLYAIKFDKNAAVKCFEKAQEKELTNADLYLEWGKVLEKFEDYDGAKLKLLKALEYEPENLEVLSYLGLCCASRNEIEEAQPILEKVLEKDPENKIVKQALGIISYEKGDIDKAIELLRIDDEDPVNSFYLAKCYEKSKKSSKVKDYYENAILHNPKYIAAYTDYAKYLISENDYAEAQRKLRKALKVDENNLTLLNLMFYVSYILVKENLCEYNVKETVSIAEKIENINKDLFEYPEQKAELAAILQNNSERDLN